MPTPAAFEKYFHDRADLAEKLHREGWPNEGHLVASVALDALANIWQHTFQKNPKRGSLRLHEFVRTFTGDPDADRIAVVFLAEDMLAHGPSRLHKIANGLLDARIPSRLPNAGPMEFRQSPAAHLDKDWPGLIAEVPALASEHKLEKIALDYTYPAMLYRLYRCGLAHSLSKGNRTSGFSGSEPDDEISYFPEWTDGSRVRPIGLKLGLKATTNWVRISVSGYAKECANRGLDPAKGFDPSAESLTKLYELWAPKKKGKKK